MPVVTELAIHQVLSFVPRVANARVEVLAARRPEVVLRRTRYSGLVVDERLLSRAYPDVEYPDRRQVIILLDGAMRLGAARGLPALELRPGDALALAPRELARARLENATFLDLEWTAAGGEADAASRLLGRVDRRRATRVGARLAAGPGDDRVLFSEAFSLFASVGATLGSLDAHTLSGSPSARDLRLARAISAQLADLRTGATTIGMSEIATLSPRQLQRAIAEYCRRYSINSASWRDYRNRLRVQIAMALLSLPSLAVRTVANEVGYRSAAALARALAALGLPPPQEVRAEIARLAAIR